MEEDQENHPRIGDAYVWTWNGTPSTGRGALVLVTSVMGDQVYILRADTELNGWKKTKEWREWFLDAPKTNEICYVRIKGEEEG